MRYLLNRKMPKRARELVFRSWNCSTNSYEHKIINDKIDNHVAGSYLNKEHQRMVYYIIVFHAANTTILFDVDENHHKMQIVCCSDGILMK